MERPLGIVIIAAGLFLLAGSIFDWEWYWARRRSQTWADLLGWTGARVAYAVVGLLLAVLATLISLGAVSV